LGANSEIVTDGKTGLLAEDDEDFRRILHDILARRFDFNALGAAAWAAVAERHNWEAHVIEIENLIEPRSE
jgi:glycosyltransferase involved in cell wall biosynthesis